MTEFAKKSGLGGVEVVNFGCRLNSSESAVIRELAIEAGVAETVVINSCAVTEGAVRQVRQAIRRLKRERPSSNIIVTGCAAQIDSAAFAAMPEVSNVLGNASKMSYSAWTRIAEGISPREQIDDIMAVRTFSPAHVDGYSWQTRAFIEIQQGCDHRCTFCIIPYGRGNSRSVPPAILIERIQRLVKRGFSEVVLTGVDIASYGRDFPEQSGLGSLVKSVLKLVPGLSRLRLSSLDPAAFDPLLFDLLADEERLMPHLHLSAQAGDDLVLKRMKRRHRSSDIKVLAERARKVRPDVALGIDVIAGFPTEDEVAFAATENMIREVDISFLHVFPYSRREGTAAARMPAVPAAVIKDRAKSLRELGNTQRLHFFERQIGSNAKVLIEEDGRGHSEHFAPVAIIAPVLPQSGTLLSVRITSCTGDELHAVPCDEMVMVA